MLEAEYVTIVNAPIADIWAYVANFQNWARYLIGFQDLKVIDERRSIWTVKGDVGILTREVEIEAVITRWDEDSAVDFTIEGITERITGQGEFRLASQDPRARAEAAVPASPDRPGWRHRLLARLARRLIQGLRRKAETSTPGAGGRSPGRPASGSPASPDGVAPAYLTMLLRIQPGGPMAPLVEVLMRPLIEPAAEDLATQIKREIEAGAQA